MDEFNPDHKEDVSSRVLTLAYVNAEDEERRSVCLGGELERGGARGSEGRWAAAQREPHNTELHNGTPSLSASFIPAAAVKVPAEAASRNQVMKGASEPLPPAAPWAPVFLSARLPPCWKST